MGKSNLEILKEGYGNFAKGDIPAVLNVFAPNIQWTEAEGFLYGGTYVGHEAVVNEVFAKLGSEWDNYTAVPEDFIDAGDRIVALGKYTGTYKATGKSFVSPFAHVWTFNDGKAVKFVQYTDTALAQKVL